MENSSNLNTHFEKLKQEFLNKKINLRESYYRNRDKFESSELFKFFHKLPKGVLNHVHFPAFNSVEDFYEILQLPEVVRDTKNNNYLVLPKDKELEPHQIK